MKMAGAIRMVSVSRGHDPRDFALFAFGGAGPLHATALARELGLPKRAGAGAAGHHQRARLRRRRSAPRLRQHHQPAGGGLDETRVARDIGTARREGEALIAQGSGQAGGDPRRCIPPTCSSSARPTSSTCRCRRPTFDREELQELFEKAYFARFKVELPEIRANLVNLNTSVIGVRAGDRPVAADRSGGARRHAGRSAARDPAGLVRRPLAGHAGLCPRETAARCRHRRPGHPRTDGRHHRARTRRPGALGRRRQHHHRHRRGLMTMTLDAITLSVIQAALQQVCDEMDLTFSRAAFSPVIAEANDRSDGIYSADDGSLIAQGSRRPAGVRRRHAVFDQDADRDDPRRALPGRRSPATSTSSTTPISAARI